MKAVFITGTDTGIGKTIVTGMLAQYLLEKGLSVITQKWIQTGCEGFPEDIETHLRLMNKPKSYMEQYLPLIVPYSFKLPASAHLAAQVEGVSIDPLRIEQGYYQLCKEFDFVIVEGIGGALVPYNEKSFLIDIAKQLNLPILVVAQNKLGCINHATLTIEAIRRRGLHIAGIVFNGCSEETDQLILKDNPRIISKLTGEMVLGELPWSMDCDVLRKAFIPIGDRLYQQLIMN